MPGISDIGLTTNGILLDEQAQLLKDAGLRRLNISLDALDPEVFKAVTRRDGYERVLAGIEAAREAGFSPIKLNAVSVRGLTEDQIVPFGHLARETETVVRFIEFMPFSGNHWENEKVVSYQEILETIASHYDFIKLRDDANATAKKFKIYNHEGTFAIISTMSAPFCSTCNRMRLTADGKMKNCLFSKGEVDLLTAYRKGEDIMPMIEQCVIEKEEALGGQFTQDYHKIDANALTNRSMIRIGG